MCLSHVCRLNLTLFPVVFEKITVKAFCTVLLEGAPRVQQAFLTMLNLSLRTPFQRLNEVLLGEPTFLSVLHKLLEHHSIVIRGKTLLAFL